MKLTEHFSTEEFTRSSTAIRLGIPNDIPQDLMANARLMAAALETIRTKFGRPIRVTSCYRAPEVNKAVGGSVTSSHRFALAVDFTVDDFSNKRVCEILQTMLTNFDQIIYEFGETGWVHLGLSKTAPRCEVLSAAKEGGKTIYKKGIV
jgi:putative chitinase